MSLPTAIQKRGVRFFIDTDAACPMKNCPPDWYVQWWTRKYKNWEPRTFVVFDTFLDSARSFIDVGAWMGPTVLYAAAKAKHVYCFEPDPEAYRVLCLNLAVNPQYSNITVLNAALSNVDGHTVFGGNGEMGNSESTMLVNDPDYATKHGEVLRTGDVSREEAWRNSVTTQVQTVCMETVEQSHSLSGVSLMKIDIEGGEKIVIPAIAYFLKKNHPTLYLSIHWVYLSEEEIASIFDTLSAIYPVIYDDSLLQTVSRERLLGEKITSIVCTTTSLSFFRVLRIRWWAFCLACRVFARSLISKILSFR